MIAIIDYGTGNTQSIVNVFNRLGIESVISSDENVLRGASKLVLPGVGSFDEVMGKMNSSGLKSLLNEIVLDQQKPILGICVGMQILFSGSEEGELPGLGWMVGTVKKLSTINLKSKPFLPHMGWNMIKVIRKSDFFNNIDYERGFYFLHSYAVSDIDEKVILSVTDYGDSFVSSVNLDNIFGTQFHPEKSHMNGSNIFLNFARLNF